MKGNYLLGQKVRTYLATIETSPLGHYKDLLEDALEGEVDLALSLDV